VVSQAYFLKILTAHADYSQERDRHAQGTVQHLLDSEKSAIGNIIGTSRVSTLQSDYPPPQSLASDVAAWNCTEEEQHCKRHVHFPELQIRWISASTRRAFGAWTDEGHGFCRYINILAGFAWIVISKPKLQSGRIFSNVSIHEKSFDPTESNSELWDIEAILVGEGSQL
jgi:hypothetical protein